MQLSLFGRSDLSVRGVSGSWHIHPGTIQPRLRKSIGRTGTIRHFSRVDDYFPQTDE